MSFASELKDELCRRVPEEEPFLHALLYGFLLFSRKFSAEEVCFSVAHEPTARLFAECLALRCGILAKIGFRERARGALYRVSVENAADRKRLLSLFYHSEREPHLRINRANLESEDCFPYFLRGAYLVCGSVSDPQKDYHLEFDITRMNLCRDLAALIGEALEGPKISMRRGVHVIYYKESENIEDLLTYMGAYVSSMNMMNVKIVKEVRNKVNRQLNCENANQDKALDAGIQQAADIRFIYKEKSRAWLSDELRAVADIRLENPDLTLREIGRMLEPNLSRSGVNHRLQRLHELAEDLRGKK
ncbi:MAG TPA: DNA-binding protein WhiA [Oscillospiraceae bacterium]|nr:DNA-binding protein WhiA [Oscillospiraceae bacterium]HNW04765.1 DNA-binding protein WhiA [Oscillospiraceae bacterium]HPV99849.1 DNA-binding protein WhiA [Oscillospiraceae bacterium]